MLRYRGLAGLLFLLPLLAACGGDDESSVPLSQNTTRLEGAHALVEVQRSPFRISIYSKPDGALLTREAPQGGLFFESDGQRHDLGRVVQDIFVFGDSPQRGFAHHFVVDTTRGSFARVSIDFPTERCISIELLPLGPETVTAYGERLESPPDEAIYGLTERLRDSRQLAGEIPVDDVRPQEVGSLNRRGESVEMFVRPTIALYAPFFHSSRGYGLSVTGTTAGGFDVAKSDPTSVSFRFEASSGAASPRLAFQVFVGPEHATILDEYTELYGRPFVPPRWAFRNWSWRDAFTDGETADLDGVQVQRQVAEDVNMSAALGIPPGVYHFDRPVLQGDFGFARFEWDDAILPNAPAMLERLRERGYHVTTWSSLWACGSDVGDNGFEAQQLGILAPGPAGAPHCGDLDGVSFILDPTHPLTSTWLKSKLTDFLVTQGIDGIKLDRGEEHIPSQASDIWADGRNGREVHNDYPTLQARLHHEALSAAHPDGDFVLITRSGYTGTQRYAIAWGGDTAGSEAFGLGRGTDLGLRSAIISQQRAAFLGYPIWGSDTGGYYIFKDREVFARWIEFSAFSGIMEIGGKGERSPWKMPTDPSYDVEMIGIYQRYTQLRETLLDYIVAAAHEAGRTGMPIVRPLVFLDRTDPELRDRWDQYMFGPDLMVAPVWKSGQRSREVYFPKGRWRSYWNESQEYVGPQTVSVDAPLDVIPVYIRGDAP